MMAKEITGEEDPLVLIQDSENLFLELQKI
jgi:hypothetical protein